MGKPGCRQGRCIFCQAEGKLTKEDATPRWLSRILNRQWPPERRWELDVIQFGGDRQYSKDTRVVGGASVHKPTVACASCNNGWMSALEQSVRPILQPLILGESRRLSQSDSVILASWATKTALVYEFVYTHREGTTVSATDRKRFADDRAPLPESRIWLGRYVGTAGPAIIRRNTLFLYDLDDSAPSPEPSAVTMTFVFGQVFIRLGLFRSNPTYPASYSVAEGPHMQLLWPSARELDWPPLEVVDDTTLPLFSAMQR